MGAYEPGIIRVDLISAKWKALFLDEFLERNPLCGLVCFGGTICYIVVPEGEEFEYAEKARGFLGLVEGADLEWNIEV